MDGSAVFRENSVTAAEGRDARPLVDNLGDASAPGATGHAGAAPAEVLDRAAIRDLFQNERGITVRIERARDAKLTEFGQATLGDRYLMPGESYQDAFARVAAHFAEYAVLATVAGVAALGLGTLAAYLVVTLAMKSAFTFSLPAALQAVGLAALLVLAFGAAGTWRVLGVRPVPYLRGG